MEKFDGDTNVLEWQRTSLGWKEVTQISPKIQSLTFFCFFLQSLAFILAT